MQTLRSSACPPSIELGPRGFLNTSKAYFEARVSSGKGHAFSGLLSNPLQSFQQLLGGVRDILWESSLVFFQLFPTPLQFHPNFKARQVTGS